ncbi:hypothetical protein CTAYLR_008887 [Chrysophaeum taylorii]|uniref:DUF1499 domain-containing protein n=1 Tax=Chrysophaeum taylorii TaxID=2483200 RepID=A0AAD7UIH3_9STRA|nr:hypothetical protein CTAYLR_008887 [Chrysophaeum taylorii]
MRLRAWIAQLVTSVGALRPLCRLRNDVAKVAWPVATYFGVMCAPVYGKGIPGLGGMVDFETLEARSSPNEYLAAPKDRCPKFTTDEKRQQAPVFPVDADELKRSFEAMLEKRYAIPAFAAPTLSDRHKRHYVYVERTPLLRFPDIINVQFVPINDRSSTLVLHSGSIYGYSDLGKNKERVTEMLAAIPNLPSRIKQTGVQV